MQTFDLGVQQHVDTTMCVRVVRRQLVGYNNRETKSGVSADL